ncbi:MAG: hypothetical protein PVH61_36405 [Candidatus Aminicenantes bacterium]|jgi:hypothetical protein
MKKQKKLVLKKTTIQSFIVSFDRDGQQEIKGGSPVNQVVATVPIFCIPISPGN